MLRFSHEANCWQWWNGTTGPDGNEWHNVSVKTARKLFDQGFDIHFM